MSQMKFNLKVPGSKGITAGDELRKLESRKEFDFRIIPIEKIEPNPKNQYPMIEIEKLYKSIKTVGKLLTPLRVRAKDEKFVIIAGERRFRAILMGIENQDPEFEIFKFGIPCMVEDKTLNEIDEEIQLIVENEERRGPDEALKSRMIARLEELFRMKNIETGTNRSIPEQIAEVMDLSKRQVQRYNAINKKLIPELKEAFENNKITAVKAAEFAALDESIQKMVAELLNETKEITNKELKEITKKAKDLEELHKNSLEEIKKLENEKVELSNKLKKAEEERQNIQELEKQIREKLKQEVTAEKPDIEKINQLEKELKEFEEKAQKFKQEAEKAKTEMEKMEDEINSLRKEIQSKDVPLEVKEKIRKDQEIKLIMNDITKKFEEIVKAEKLYKQKYNESILSWEEWEKLSEIIAKLY